MPVTVFRVLRLLLQFPSTLFRVRQLVELSAKLPLQVRQVPGFHPVFAGDGLHGVEPLFDQVLPARIHIDRIAVTPQRVACLGNLYPGTVQEFHDGGQLFVELDQALQRPLCRRKHAAHVARVVVGQAVQCCCDTLGEPATVSEALCLRLQLRVLAGTRAQ